MNACVRVLGTLALALPVLMSGQLAAQSVSVKESPNTNLSEQQELIATALQLTTEAAKRYEIKVGEAEKTIAKQSPEPVLRWSNPAAGEIHGNVFLWTLQERPVAIGSLFKWFSPHTHTSHEFHSLSESPLEVTYEGRSVWKTKSGGIKFSTLEGPFHPATTAGQRLLQMRSLAKNFEVTKIDRDNSQQELRLLTQPIYRYSAATEKVLDGGLFVFVQGTDPEVFLMLEARGDGDAARWNFAAARMNSVGFQARFREREVWRAEIMPWREVGSHTEIYTTFRFDEIPSKGK